MVRETIDDDVPAVSMYHPVVETLPSETAIPKAQML